MAEDSRATAAWRRQQALAPAAALLWGLLCWQGDRLDGGAALAFNTGGPWLLLAFLLGALGRNPLAGALFAAQALGVAVLTYFTAYEIALAFDPGGSQRYFVPGGAAWFVVALAAGAGFGAAGALARSSRSRLRMAGVAPIGGALLGEAALIATDLALTGSGDIWAFAFLVVEGLTGLALPLALSRRGALRLTLLATLALGALGVLVQLALLDFLATRYRA